MYKILNTNKDTYVKQLVLGILKIEKNKLEKKLKSTEKKVLNNKDYKKSYLFVKDIHIFNGFNKLLKGPEVIIVTDLKYLTDFAPCILKLDRNLPNDFDYFSKTLKTIKIIDYQTLNDNILENGVPINSIVYVKDQKIWNNYVDAIEVRQFLIYSNIINDHKE